MTVKELTDRIKSELQEAGYAPGEAKGVSEIILGHQKGWSPSEIVLNYQTELSPVIIEGAEKIVDRVNAGEPVQYVLGEARFYGMDFEVNRDVLIPRPETEELVELIVKENPQSDLRILDVGTGSGCIAISLARNLRFPVVTAIDISQKALSVAIRNAAKFKTRIRFEEDDIFHFSPAPCSFDIIVSNPPYICEKEKGEMEPLVLENEPASALFVPNDDPLLFYRRIAMVGATALAPGGRLYFEINPLYAEEIRSLLNGLGYTDINLSEDMSHKLRFASARRETDADD